MMEFEREFEIDIDSFINNYKIEKGITHLPNRMFKMLPFVANDKKVVTDFKGVLGAFVRLINERQSKIVFNKEEFFERLYQIVYFEEEEQKEILKNIVENTILNDEELAVFNLRSLNYIKSESGDEKIAKFLYSLLSGENILNECKNVFIEDDDNVLYQLVFNVLPELEKTNVKDDLYYCSLPYVRELFAKDLNTIIKDKELLQGTLQRILEYYYFFYISQLSIKLNKFEDADLTTADAVFFTLSWESTSKKRQAYILGWEYLKKQIENLFSHTNTLELLNYNKSGIKMDYVKLGNYMKECNENQVVEEIRNLRQIYSEAVKNSLKDFVLGVLDEKKNDGVEEVHSLFETVEYQFQNSSRKRAYEAYRNWFVYFTQANFGKRRGALGYNLNLTEEDIILFTKIITQQQGGRIRLNTLFSELEKRGMCFDKFSKASIVELYEKLNLLEKKSDSGDAQYVRSIL